MAASTTDSRDFDVQQFDDTVQGVFAGKTAFMGSVLASQGAVIVRDGMMAGDPSWIGNEITVPFWGVIGEFQDNPEDQSVTPVALKATHEKATVERSTLPFEVTTWARHSFANGEDPYVEAARQMAEAAARKMDTLVIGKAKTTPLVVDLFSETSPQYLDWDAIVEGRAKWGDRQDSIVAMAIHSRVEADLRKLRDDNGRPLLVDSLRDGELTRFCGVPLIISDQLPLDGSGMTAVVSDGTTPPVATLTGTPTGPWDLHIECLASHASDTTIRFSTDGGNTWSGAIEASDDGVAVALTDPAPDSLVGKNGKTGLSVAFASGTFNVDNTWTSKAVMKATSLIVQKGALAFWYNRQALRLQTDKDILKDNDVAAMHLYAAPHIYRRRVGGVLPGVVALKTNVRGFTGAIA